MTSALVAKATATYDRTRRNQRTTRLAVPCELEGRLLRYDDLEPTEAVASQRSEAIVAIAQTSPAQ